MVRRPGRFLQKPALDTPAERLDGKVLRSIDGTSYDTPLAVLRYRYWRSDLR